VQRPRISRRTSSAIGFERVPMVEDVAQFSCAAASSTSTAFGMAEPVRLEFWGDEIVELRHFDVSSQRTTRTRRKWR
jgi:transcription-repair coupling factor (superfamily II helicase)